MKSELWFGKGSSVMLGGITGVVVQSVEEQAPALSVSDSEMAAGYGKRLNVIKKSTVDVRVTFGIRSWGMDGVQRMINRSHALENIRAVCMQTNEIRISTRPGRMLRCACISMPDMAGVNDLGHTWQMTFRSYPLPYWQDVVNRTMAELGANDGSASTVLCWRVPVTSATTAVKVAYDDQYMEYTGLTVSGDGTCDIYTTEDAIQRADIIVGTTVTSILGKRTAASADDLIIGGNEAYDSSVAKITVNGTERSALDTEVYIRRRWI